MHGGDENQPVEPFVFAVFQVAQHQPKHHQPPEYDEDFVAGVAAVEEDVGRDQKQRARDQCTDPAQVTPPGKKGKGDYCQTEQGGWNAGRKVGIPKHEIGKSQGMELERTVRDRIVHIIAKGVGRHHVVDLVV